jgi:hypothetical protein
MAYIYKITNPNGRIYIGQTTDIKTRWNKYKKLSCKDQPSLYTSLIKHKPENHIFEIIEEWPSGAVAAKELGLKQSNIHSAYSGKTKSCGNFIWIKKEEKL